MLGKLNTTQITSILSSQMLGRLACCDGKQPYIIPVNYAYDGKFIYAQSNEGSKLSILRNNPAVCFEVDIMTDMRNWQSVVACGQFEELRGADAEKARELLFGRVFPLLTESTVHGFGHREEGEVDDSTRVKQTMFRIRISSMTGRFEKQ